MHGTYIVHGGDDTYKILLGRPEFMRPHRRHKVWGCGLDSAGWGWGPLAGSCEYCNEPSGSRKDREYLD